MRAYGETYGLPVTITNCSNNYGPYQFPEKVIPVFTTAALDDKNLTLYATTENRREWLHVRDHCTAIEAVLERGAVGETYHVGSGIEASIMEIADLVLKTLGKPASLKEIVPDRPGHDRRYLLDSSKLRTRLGWAPSIAWEDGLAETVEWYAANRCLVGAAAGPGTGRRGRMGFRRLTPVRRMRVLVTGADGQLGRDLLDALERTRAGGRSAVSPAGAGGPVARSADEVLATDIGTMRVDERDAVQYVFRAFGPELVLHGGALTAVDACETDVDLAYAVNAIGTRNVAEAATAVGAHMLYVSTDYVFDGTSTRPYREWDAPNPKSVYGASKLAGERECPPGSTIVRTSWVCGAHGKNMVKTVLAAGRGDRPAALRRRSARIAHLHRRPGRGHRHPGDGPPARHLSRDQQRGHHLVRLRPGHHGGGRRRPGARAGDLHRRPGPVQVPRTPAGQLGARQHGAPAQRIAGPAGLERWTGPAGAGVGCGRGSGMTARTSTNKNKRATDPESRAVAVIGAGYVGLPTAATLAHFGHRVVLAERDPSRLAALRSGRMPIVEVGLDDLVAEGVAAGNLHFTASAAEAVAGAAFVFLCVPTPQGDDGSADLSFVEAAAKEVGPLLEHGTIVVNKSTVPVGSATFVEQIIGRSDVRVVSNPEFLREGNAVRDSLHPDRLVVGADDAQAAATGRRACSPAPERP